MKQYKITYTEQPVYDKNRYNNPYSTFETATIANDQEGNALKSKEQAKYEFMKAALESEDFSNNIEVVKVEVIR